MTTPTNTDAPAPVIKLDVVSLLVHASTPVRITIGLLILAGVGVWLIGFLKYLQISRLNSAERAFVRASAKAGQPRELHQSAMLHGASPGARIVLEMASRGQASVERLRAAAERALATERSRASSLMSTLGSIAAASPFVGLFGTVYGIMDAFIRIGQEKSASLPVVAPAIGEALVTTAIGLAAAIPALVFYNSMDKRVGELIETVESSVAEWALILGEHAEELAVPLTRPSSPMAACPPPLPQSTPHPGRGPAFPRS